MRMLFEHWGILKLGKATSSRIDVFLYIWIFCKYLEIGQKVFFVVYELKYKRFFSRNHFFSLRKNTHRIDLLFDLCKAFSNVYISDFTFLRLFIENEVIPASLQLLKFSLWRTNAVFFFVLQLIIIYTM